MNRVRVSQGKDGTFYVAFWCPGCNYVHMVLVGGGVRWNWNGSLSKPTLSPSILVHGNRPGPDTIPGYVGTPRCHSHVTDGRIAFDVDTEHALASRIVDLSEANW